MKYIKLFENYFAYKLTEIIGEIKKHKIGDVISFETMYNYVEALHDFDMDNDYITNFITDNSEYVLTKLKISEVGLDSISPSLVSEYKEEYLSSKWYPPILYNLDEKEIIDGYHRAQMIDDIGEEFINAWVQKLN
jgi:hypothetical protein